MVLLGAAGTNGEEAFLAQDGCFIYTTLFYTFWITVVVASHFMIACCICENGGGISRAASEFLDVAGGVCCADQGQVYFEHASIRLDEKMEANMVCMSEVHSFYFVASQHRCGLEGDGSSESKSCLLYTSPSPRD